MPSIGSTTQRNSALASPEQPSSPSSETSGKRRVQNLRDQFLAAHVEFELDVVGLGGVHMLGPVPVVTHDFSGGARGLNGGFLGGG
ncbi:MAG: hypothetical protein WDN00_04095 [Limisphaerales bacterium]